MLDIPSHYHNLKRITARMAATDQAEKDHAARTVARRDQADRVERNHEVHVTGNAGTGRG